MTLTRTLRVLCTVRILPSYRWYDVFVGEDYYTPGKKPARGSVAFDLFTFILHIGRVWHSSVQVRAPEKQHYRYL